MTKQKQGYATPGSKKPLLQKGALYIRVSTHWQIDKDSLPVQRNELINYCKFALNLESFEVFEDAGYSAKNTERPAYRQMMARLRAGEFSHLVVWKIDRISRNLIDFATMYEEIKRLGVAFVSKNEQFDTSSAMGEAMLKIILNCLNKSVSVVTNFCIKDGRVESIRFKNGVEHRFSYKGEEI